MTTSASRLSISIGQIRLGIEAPLEVPIFRKELLSEPPLRPVTVLAAKG